jgi:cellobiose phosphorylase
MSARSESVGPQLVSASGLRAEFNANGSLRRFDCDALSLNLFPGNELEGGPTNIYLRRRAGRVECTPLLGPRSPTRFREDDGRLVGTGSWLEIDYTIALVLAASTSAWFWHVRLEHSSGEAQSVDLTYAQDLALAPYGAVRMNEYYVSQYIDHTPLAHDTQGVVLASRQNQAVDGRYPWCLIGSLRRGVSFGTDALQLYGLASRAAAMPAGLGGELPGQRLQHEHSMAVIRDTAAALAPRAHLEAGFFGWLIADHPEATAASDVARVNGALALAEAKPIRVSPRVERAGNSESLFSRAALLEARDLDPSTLRELFPGTWRLEERDEHGAQLAFFHGDERHVVLRAKELRTLRPHGQLLRSGCHMTPDETGLTSTAWMAGVFHSLLTQGHVSINRMLSTVRSYLGLFRSHGLRVFVEVAQEWRLLDVPSAFEMEPNACRWFYHHERGLIEVCAEASAEARELKLSVQFRSGEAARCLISQHVALNGDDGSSAGAVRWSRHHGDLILVPPPDSEIGTRFPDGSFRITPLPGTQLEQVGGDELLFLDGASRSQPYLCIITAPAKCVGLTIRGELVKEETPPPLRVAPTESLVPALQVKVATAGAHAEQLRGLAELAPWLTQNAWVHYLSPRGLEQYSGGGWGTRDVCQGPVEMLLALGRPEPIRDLLLRVLRAQNADGDWPQWFMFFERERNIRPSDSHGDIVFWPLLVLAQYLIASGDAAVLDEVVPFFDARGPQAGERASVWGHIERALTVIDKRVIPGTALAAYGHGDWNDSLQPADPALRESLCSAWTVTLHFQTFMTLARALRPLGRTVEADRFESRAQAVKRDFQRLLVVDGVLTGYAHFEDQGRVRYLLHPRDATTGVCYSALAMIHAMLEDLLTPEQARAHLALIEQHLSGPDGARLFDRPMTYHGGPERIFQRAETATFFGREIGLMYTHAHLRYAQALAHLGEAERFFEALCRANPIGVRALVPTATLRQSNCYYSSSDAAFADRYQASAEYARVARGTIALDGGWRVYSSGAGIALGLIMRRLLGMSLEAQALRLDPVIPSALDGLIHETTLLAHPTQVQYRIGRAGCGVNAIELNGQPLEFNHEDNPHRRGAALVPRAALVGALLARNTLRVDLG